MLWIVINRRENCAEFHNPVPSAATANNYFVLTAIVKLSDLRKGKDKRRYEVKTAGFFLVPPYSLVDTSQSCRNNEVIRDVHSPIPSYRKRELIKPRKRWKEERNNSVGLISEQKCCKSLARPGRKQATATKL